MEPFTRRRRRRRRRLEYSSSTTTDAAAGSCKTRAHQPRLSPIIGGSLSSSSSLMAEIHDIPLFLLPGGISCNHVSSATNKQPLPYPKIMNSELTSTLSTTILLEPLLMTVLLPFSRWCFRKILLPMSESQWQTPSVEGYKNGKNCKHALRIVATAQTLRGGSQLQADDYSEDRTPPSVGDTTTTTTTTTTEFPIVNPLWPGGVNEEDVNDLIGVCLQDPQLNIRGIPDALERQLYKSIIRLTLNGVYQGLAQCHGQSLLGHWITINRNPGDTITCASVGGRGTQESSSRAAFRAALKRAMEELQFERDVEEDVLEMVADRMLANPDVNLRFLPDGLERALYVNCLKVLFRVLNLLSATMTLTVCGHDMKIQLETSTRYAVQEAALRQSSENFNTLTNSLDFEQVKQFVRTNNHRLLLDESCSTELWFWQRWWSYWNPSRYELMVQLHASLYSLLLSILDDLMDHTSIQILSDNIRFDVMASDKGTELPVPNASAVSTELREEESTSPANTSTKTSCCRPFRSFLSTLLTLCVGISAGLSLQKAVPLPRNFPVLEPQALPPVFQSVLSRLGLIDVTSDGSAVLGGGDAASTKLNHKPWWR